MKIEQLGQNQLYYIDRLLKGDYLETDGMNYWLVEGRNYIDADPKNVVQLVYRQIIIPKRIDDETTQYFLTEEAQTYFSKNTPRLKKAS